MAAALIAVLILILIQQPYPVGQGTVLVIENIDANVAGNGLEATNAQIAAAAAELAAQGGGTLAVIAASGGAAQTVSTANLEVERNGEPETDAQVRDRVVARRVSDALKATDGVWLAEHGRNLLSLFAAVEEHAPLRNQPFTIFYVGFGLATVDPTDARIALAGEPSQAVNVVQKQLPQLSGAQLHVVFPAAAGPQPALNAATAAWREEYWTQLAQAMDATLASVTSALQPAAPADSAPPAPVIPNIPDPTPVPLGDPSEPPEPDAPVVFGGGSFLPDSDQFANPDDAARALEPLAAAWAARPGAYSGAECIGRTAAIGPAPSARALSQQRAERAAALLEDGGVTRTTATGAGFDDPLPDYPPTDPHQRSVVCQLIPQR